MIAKGAKITKNTPKYVFAIFASYLVTRHPPLFLQLAGSEPV
jgi:hypothetical protein